MTLAVEIPDAERLLWEFLRDDVDASAVVAPERIVSHAPDDTGAPFVIMRRISSRAVGGNRPLVAELVRIDLHCYGGPKSLAYRIADTIRQAVHERAVGQHDRGVVAKAEAGAMLYLPDAGLQADGDKGGPRPRYLLEVRITVKPPARPPA